MGGRTLRLCCKFKSDNSHLFMKTPHQASLSPATLLDHSFSIRPALRSVLPVPLGQAMPCKSRRGGPTMMAFPGKETGTCPSSPIQATEALKLTDPRRNKSSRPDRSPFPRLPGKWKGEWETRIHGLGWGNPARWTRLLSTAQDSDPWTPAGGLVKVTQKTLTSRSSQSAGATF